MTTIRGETYWRVIGVLLSMGDTDGPWLSSSVIQRLCPLDSEDEVTAALRRATMEQHACLRSGLYTVTIVGREEYDRVSRYPVERSAVQDRTWLDEALTGIDARGRRSRITRGVAIGTETRSRKNTVQEQTIAMIERIRSIARRIGRDEVETATLIESGSLRQCTRCGVISVHRPRGDGRGFSSWCRDCERGYARQYAAQRRAATKKEV